MIEFKNERLQIVNSLISSFKDNFYRETGFKSTVTVEGLVNTGLNYSYINKPSLIEIEECINKFMPYGSPYQNIKAHTRKREIVDLRKVFARISRDMGYTWKQCGNHFNYDHTTMIHNYNAATNLIGADTNFTNLYTNVLKALNNDFGTNDGDSQTTSEPEPVIFDVVDSGQDDNSVDQLGDGIEDFEDRWLGNRTRLSHDPSPKFNRKHRELVPTEEQKTEKACLRR